MEAEARLKKMIDQRREASRRFYHKNKEEMAERFKQYINKTGYLKQKIQCACGKTVSRGSFYAHKKSKIHETLLKQIQSDSLLALSQTPVTLVTSPANNGP